MAMATTNMPIPPPGLLLVHLGKEGRKEGRTQERREGKKIRKERT
jgi:hypothetical protein